MYIVISYHKQNMHVPSTVMYTKLWRPWCIIKYKNCPFARSNGIRSIGYYFVLHLVVYSKGLTKELLRFGLEMRCL